MEIIKLSQDGIEKVIQNRIRNKIDELNNQIVIPYICSFNFCCSILNSDTINQGFKVLFDKIDDSLPTIYWFEIASKKPSDLIDRISICRKETKFNVPPISRNKDTSEKVLYVCQRKDNFSNQIKQHLGYGSPSTGSLHLKHWTSDLDLELKLCYIQLSKKTSSLELAISKQCIAEELKPMLGNYSL